MEDNYGLLGFKEVIIKKKDKMWKLKVENNLLFGRIESSFMESTIDFQKLGIDFSGLFSLDICTYNELYELHFSYKNNKEQIIYRCFSEKNADVINMASDELEKVTFQKICLIGNTVNLIAFTENEHTKKWRIYYCFKKEGIWSKIQIIDEGWGYSPGTCSIVAHNNYLYLVYQVYDNGKYQLVYKVGMENEWSERSIITVSEGMNISPSAVIDNNGNLHLVWLRRGDLKFKVMYIRKFKTQGFWLRTGWTKEQCISPQEGNYLLPVIYGWDEDIEVFWQDKDLIYSYLISKQKLCPVKNILVSKNGSSVFLNLEKIPGINLITIEPASTTLFLLIENSVLKNSNISEINNPLNLLQEKIEEQKAVIEGLETDLSEQKRKIKILWENEKLQETKIKELKDKLLKKNQEDILKTNKFDEKKIELEQEIDRLRQSLEAVKKINDELRERLPEKEKEARELKQNEINSKEFKSKEYPPSPFLRWK